MTKEDIQTLIRHYKGIIACLEDIERKEYEADSDKRMQMLKTVEVVSVKLR